MDNRAQDKLKALSNSYAKSLPGKLTLLDAHWKDLLEHFTKSAFVDFHRAIHTLCGSAGTYGYLIMSQHARTLEIYLKDILNVESLTDKNKKEITEMLKVLTSTAVVPQLNLGSMIQVPEVKVANKRVFLMDDDTTFYNTLNNNLQSLKYELLQIKNFEDFLEQAEKEAPAVIVIDSSYLHEVDAQIFLDFIKQHQTALICISSVDDLPTRLMAIRAGVTFFVRKPVNISYLTRILDRLCENLTDEVYRVLIVDDSAPLAQYYAVVLQDAGMETLAITDPMNLLEVISEFRPHLLLLDFYMPSCTGLELATILRQEERYASLPIIFLSTEDDKLKQLATISGGADDFLTKPILPQHLISIVKSRIKRSATLTTYIQHDSLTKLLNHTYILQLLELEMARGERQNTIVSFAMVDIDHFKKINDVYGHLVGDMVLAKASEFLATRLRKTDFVGRYGGEEFAIILPNTAQTDAARICDSLRLKFSELKFSVEGEDFHISFSVGVSSYPEYNVLEELIDAADQALYRAKNNGRNRVEISEKKL
jgi:diguanylate cyclase (GGDEF)-like protein